MAIKHSTSSSSALYGIWLGGTFLDVRPARYTNPETKEESIYQVATIHVTGANADYVSISMDASMRFTPPADVPLLFNVIPRVNRDGKLRYQLLKDWAVGSWIPSPNVTTRDGEVTPLVGTIAVVDFEALESRSYSDRNTGKVTKRRWFKVHLKRPTKPEYPSVNLSDTDADPAFIKGQALSVPVSLSPYKRDIGYRLNPEFEIIQALEPDLAETS
jgi:hypothetical protein